MKTFFILSLLIAVCATDAPAQESQTERDIEMYTRLWDEVLNHRHIDAINEEHFHRNIVLVTEPENVEGIENVRAYYQNHLTGFSGIQFTIVDIFGDGDKLVKHWNFKGTHTGDFFGIPATDRKVDIEGVTLIRMKNGKILEERDFMDHGELMRQLGLTSANSAHAESTPGAGKSAPPAPPTPIIDHR